jgi:hypothetical protein
MSTRQVQDRGGASSEARCHRSAAATRQSLLRYLAGLSVVAHEGPSTGTLADVPTELLTAVLAHSSELGWQKEDRDLLFAVLATDPRDSIRRALKVAKRTSESR